MAGRAPRQAHNAGLHAGLAALLRGTDWQGAAQEYRTAIQLAPSDARWYAGLGTALEHGWGQLDAAVSAYQIALRLDPESQEAQQGLVRTLAQRARFQSDIEDLQQKAAASPTNAQFQYGLGVARIAVGDLDGAAKSFTRAVELDPKYGRAEAQLAIVRYLRNDYAGAWDAVQKAEALNAPADEELVRSLRVKAPR